MKTCIKCNKNLSLVFFHKDKYQKDGYSKRCKDCAKIAYVKWRTDNPDRYKESNKKTYLKNKGKNSKYKLEWQRRYRKEHAEEARKYAREYKRTKQQQHRLKTYGITQEMYDFLKQRQNNSCGICGRMFIDKTSPQIDHCHKTGKVRGLLCWNCNIRLGYLENEIFQAQSKKYLQCEYIEIKNKES
jgi:hypothetical protein